MNTTKPELRIRVGADNHPITLTDSAVEAVQAEAVGRLDEHVEEVRRLWDALPETDAVRVEELLGLQGSLQGAASAIDVLLECRPAEEWTDPDELDDA